MRRQRVSGIAAIGLWLGSFAAWAETGGLPAQRFTEGTIDFRPGSALIALTFDDGPSARTTAKLLDELGRRGLRATFFVNAYRFGGKSETANQQRALLLREAAEGHDIGNHTWDHARLSDLSAAAQEKEILDGERGIERALGHRTWLFRPPFGRMAPAAAKVLGKRGYTVVQWNLSSDDPYLRRADKVVAKVMRELDREEGGVLLMHDTHPWSVEALPLVLDAIASENCHRVEAGKRPYLIVGLDRFWRKGYRMPPSSPGSAAAHAAGAPAAKVSKQEEKVMVEQAQAGAKAPPISMTNVAAEDAAARTQIERSCRLAQAKAEALKAPAATNPVVVEPTEQATQPAANQVASAAIAKPPADAGAGANSEEEKR